MTWRVARSLDVLLTEINERAPKRNKVSDGSIGDAAHASRSSDHNPWVKDASGTGVVRARDFTHDPAGGLDCNWLAAEVASLLGNHPALTNGAYVIWNRRIISTDRKGEGWRAYTGSNGHTQHCHVSVGTSGYDTTAPWLVPKPAPKPAGPTKAQRKKARQKLENVAAWLDRRGIGGSWWARKAKSKTHAKKK